MAINQKTSDNPNTDFSNVHNVLRYMYGDGSLTNLVNLLEERKQKKNDCVIYVVDEFFRDRSDVLSELPVSEADVLLFVSTKKVPATSYIDSMVERLIKYYGKNLPCAIVSMGGGLTLDIAKAISNLLTNGGKTEEYQGSNLVKCPGIYKIGIPTLSGTGAEATRTCVMTNQSGGIKSYMNSDHTVYDQLILDHGLTRTVPRSQYFFTGMTAYIHCFEAINGSYRNTIRDAFLNPTIGLCREVFFSDDMMSDEGREKMMVASYLGGCAFQMGYVGVVYPFSVALSIVCKMHHAISNCVAMRAMHNFYPKHYEEFWSMVNHQNVEIPRGVCSSLSDNLHDELYDAMIGHEKSLTNALGADFRNILDRKQTREIFEYM